MVMRLKFNEGFAPLVAAGLVALAMACSPGVVDAVNSPNAPTLNNIYVIDTDGPRFALPSVLIYSSVDSRVSPNPPPAWPTYQVEFDRPLSASTIAVAENLSTRALGPLTFCNPPSSDRASGAVKFIDVDAGNVPVPASVCYDPASVVGSNPHVVITLGRGLTAGSPFTCQTFTKQTPGNAGGGVGSLVPNHQYSIQFSSTVTGNNGQPLAFPTGAGWSGGQFTFKTSGFAIMAAGFNDPVTNYYSWHRKPFPGFMKDLNAAEPTPASCNVEADCQLTQVPQPDQVATQFGQTCVSGKCQFRMQTLTLGDPFTPMPYMLVATEILANPAGVPFTVTRGDGTNFPVSADFWTNPSGRTEKRVVAISPAGAWEPGVTYTLTVPASLTAADRTTTLGTAQTFTFTAGNAPLAVLVPTYPDLSSSSVAIDLSDSPTTGVNLLYQAPVDSTRLTGVALFQGPTPTPSALVPATVGVAGGTNNQVVTITPTGNLKSGTLYTIQANNVVAASPFAGQAFRPFTTSFTTRYFNAVSVSPSGRNVSPTALQTGVGATVTYTEPATNISTSTVKVFEGSTAGKAVTVTVTSASGGTKAQVKTSQPVKFNQKYVIQSVGVGAGGTPLQSVSGLNLQAEGCTSGDCSDLKAFTTAPFGGALGSRVTNTSFTFTFNNPVVPSSLAPYLTTSTATSTSGFLLFKQGAGGVRTAVPGVICALDATNTTVTCTFPAPLFNPADPNTFNQTYIVVAALAPTPVQATATTASGVPVDQTTGLFTGGATGTVVTPCQ